VPIFGWRKGQPESGVSLDLNTCIRDAHKTAKLGSGKGQGTKEAHCIHQLIDSTIKTTTENDSILSNL
jgi:23S rRNA maturation-related 3'-5' exoribonuclease YhaM